MVGITELVIVCIIGLILTAAVGAAIFIIVRKQQSPAVEGTPCPHCGSLNPKENKFCGNCGSSL